MSKKTPIQLQFCPVFHLRKVPDPFGNGAKYVFDVQTSQVPSEIEEWKDVNPRDVRESGAVYDSILQTLEEDAENFHHVNRGLTILAQDVDYDEKTKTVRLTLSEKNKHGLVDGGHTARACIKHGTKEAWVPVQVKITTAGMEIVSVAGGLNRSNQVDLKSLVHMDGYFDELKKAIKGQPYEKEIGYKMFDESGTIDVRMILYYLRVFDCARYAKVHPYQVFGRKEQLVKDFEAEAKDLAPEYPDSFKILLTKTADILKLRDDLEEKLLQKEYSLGRLMQDPRRGTRVRSPRNRQRILQFTKRNVDGQLSLGHIMPMLGGFRANVDWNRPKGGFSWKVPLDKLLPEVAERLSQTIVAVHRQENARPEYVGRNSLAWLMCYQVVESQVDRMTMRTASA
jgi:hypothetical protein